MANSKADVKELFRTIGYSVPNSEIDDYVALLDKSRAAFEAIEAMDGVLSLK